MKTWVILGMVALLTLYPIAMNGQRVCVAGKILDKITGETIKQLSVVEKNSGIGTISSDNGIYSLILKPGKVVLSFFDEKYEMYTTSFFLKSDTTINIVMSALSMKNGKKAKREIPRQEGTSEVAETSRQDKK